jgi:hypothetical protein
MISVSANLSSKYNPGDLGSKLILTPTPKTVEVIFPIQDVKKKDIKITFKNFIIFYPTVKFFDKFLF